MCACLIFCLFFSFLFLFVQHLNQNYPFKSECCDWTGTQPENPFFLLYSSNWVFVFVAVVVVQQQLFTNRHFWSCFVRVCVPLLSDVFFSSRRNKENFICCWAQHYYLMLLCISFVFVFVLWLRFVNIKRMLKHLVVVLGLPLGQKRDSAEHRVQTAS